MSYHGTVCTVILCVQMLMLFQYINSFQIDTVLICSRSAFSSVSPILMKPSSVRWYFGVLSFSSFKASFSDWIFWKQKNIYIVILLYTTTRLNCQFWWVRRCWFFLLQQCCLHGECSTWPEHKPTQTCSADITLAPCVNIFLKQHVTAGTIFNSLCWVINRFKHLTLHIETWWYLYECVSPDPEYNSALVWWVCMFSFKKKHGQVWITCSCQGEMV